MAPELFTKKEVGASPGLDVWALGCILYSLVTGVLPFKASKGADVKLKIVNDPVEFPNDIPLSDEIQDIIQRMLDKNTETRATTFEISDHAWINGRNFTPEEKERRIENLKNLHNELNTKSMKGTDLDKDEDATPPSGQKKFGGSFSPKKVLLLNQDQKKPLNLGSRKTLMPLANEKDIKLKDGRKKSLQKDSQGK